MTNPRLDRQPGTKQKCKADVIPSKFIQSSITHIHRFPSFTEIETDCAHSPEAVIIGNSTLREEEVDEIRCVDARVWVWVSNEGGEECDGHHLQPRVLTQQRCLTVPAPLDVEFDEQSTNNALDK